MSGTSKEAFSMICEDLVQELDRDFVNFANRQLEEIFQL